VRKAGGRVRVTAQLTETAAGSHLWAQRYDRELADIFMVQDELISAIVSTLEGRVVAAGAVAAQRKLPQNWSAYDFFLRGRDLTNGFRAREAEPYFTQAIAIDPDFAQAHAFRVISLVLKYCLDQDATTLDQARRSSERASNSTGAMPMRITRWRWPHYTAANSIVPNFTTSAPLP
jgi:adenylate cyclase